ncbi:MAG: shikimate dehydrogenase [Gammaproteobacteria bacterium]|nr:shikimate dehydrogenase [Gammaproteobacteria bacterium]
MDQYRVVGNPIKHSKSPQIHQQFAASTQQDIEYSAQLVAEDDFEQFVHDFFAKGGKGLNITVPFKQRAFAMAQHPSTVASMAQAANTLWCNEAGELCADNTDGVGMVRDIMLNLGGHLAGRRILVLGAGGAVRGVLALVMAQRPALLVIANRTPSKAQQLVESMHYLGRVKTCSFAELEGPFDWVINGTAASLTGDLPPLPDGLLAPQARTYDMMYGAEPTVFSRWARAQGAVVADDGLGMLVEQAAESFAIWRGVRPNTRQVLSWLRQQL